MITIWQIMYLKACFFRKTVSTATSIQETEIKNSKFWKGKKIIGNNRKSMFLYSDEKIFNIIYENKRRTCKRKSLRFKLKTIGFQKLFSKIMKSNFMNVIIVRNPVKEVKAEIKQSIFPKISHPTTKSIYMNSRHF